MPTKLGAVVIARTSEIGGEELTGRGRVDFHEKDIGAAAIRFDRVDRRVERGEFKVNPTMYALLSRSNAIACGIAKLLGRRNVEYERVEPVGSNFETKA